MGAMGVILGLGLRGVFFVEVGDMGGILGLRLRGVFFCGGGCYGAILGLRWIGVGRGGAIGWIEVGEFVDFCLLFDLWTFGSLSGFWRVARVRGVYRNALHFDPRFKYVGLVFSLLDGVLWGFILGLRLTRVGRGALLAVFGNGG